MKCTKCGGELILGSQQVGVDDNGLPIIHRTGTCQQCGVKFDFDKKPIDNKKKKVQKKDTALGTTALVLSLFGCTTILSLVLALIDLGIGDKERKHSNAKGALVVCGIYFVIGILPFILLSGNNQNNKESETQYIYNVGTVYASDSLRITFVSSEEHFEENEYLQPKEGFTYYRLVFEIENIGKNDKYVSASDFNAYADGYSTNLTFITGDDYLSATLSPGKKTKNSIYYEIPIETKELLIEYKENVFKDEKVVFKAK